MKILVFNDDGVTPAGFLTNVTLSGDLRLIAVDGLVATGGSSNDSQGDGEPVAPPADVNSSGFYTDRLTAIVYSWNTDTQAWI